MTNQNQSIYPDGIREAVEANTERLEGYTLITIIQGGLDVNKVKVALFKRPHAGSNEFAATDILAIDSRGMISEMPV